VPAVPSSVELFLDYFTHGQGFATPDHFISDDELLKEIQIGEAWLWRARAQRVLNLKQDLALLPEEERKTQLKKIPNALRNVMEQIEDAIALGSERAKEEGLITQVADGDFGILNDGKTRYADAGDHQLREMGRVAEARIACLGWLSGKNDPFDYVEGQVQFINPMGSIWAPAE